MLESEETGSGGALVPLEADSTRSQAADLAADRFHDQFMLNGWSPGTVVTYIDMGFIVGQRRPTPDENCSYAEGQKMQQAFYFAVSDMRPKLLKKYQVDLENVPGRGYRIIDPKEQVQVAADNWQNKIQKETRWAKARMTHVDQSGFTEEDRRKRTDELARLGAYQQMMRRSKPKTWS